MLKDKLLSQALLIHLNTDQKVLEQIHAEWDHFQKLIKELKKINVSGVAPMTRVDPTPITSLREDVPANQLASATFLKNAPVTKDRYVVLKREVEHD